MIRQTSTHLVIKRIRIRKCHVKAALAYSGAFLMGIDAGVAIAPGFAPHLYFVLHHFETMANVGGKLGAASAGFTAFLDDIIRPLPAAE